MTLLTDAEITALGPFPGWALGLWDDVQVLAHRVHAAAPVERDLVWHHLLLAVANFKADYKLHLPALIRGGRVADIERRPSLHVATAEGELLVVADGPATWRQLERRVRGLGIARTTTVLSALWPDEHVIIDRRALSATFGLVGPSAGWQPPLPEASTTNVKVTWDAYEWYRGLVLDDARALGLPPVIVERALYRLAVRVGVVPGRSWAEYAHRIDEERRALTAKR